MYQIIEQELQYLDNNWPKNLPTGIIHGDIFPDNVFFIDNFISGLIDFYFSCNDFYAYELAITTNAWCFDTKDGFNKNNFESLLNGYQKNSDINNAFDYSIKFSPTRKLILEEWLSGSQLSTESLVISGKTHLCGIADRNYSNQKDTFPYIVEDGGETPSRYYPKIKNKLEKIYTESL